MIEEAAEANLEDRTKLHEEVFGSAIKDEFYFQGEIDHFFQAQTFSDLGLKEWLHVVCIRTISVLHSNTAAFDHCDNTLLSKRLFTL